MIVLFESPLGYALVSHTPTSTTLLASHKFEDTDTALDSLTTLKNSKLPSNLKSFLRAHKEDIGNTLIVTDKTTAKKISDKIGVPVDTDLKILREIRPKMPALLGISEHDYNCLVLALAHKMCIDKIKYNPDMIDNFVVQAIGQLEDLDTQMNNEAMRVREWYGCHFPELSEMFTDNLQYLHAVCLIHNKESIVEASEERIDGLRKELRIEDEKMEVLLGLAEKSVGGDMTVEDILRVVGACSTLIETYKYREDLNKYMCERMGVIAPNLTALVGEVVGARLLARAGSLSALAKAPASTVQIFGAEKAFFTAIKGRTNTPKYGIIYHAPLINLASQEKKGVVARKLAAKVAIACKIDYFRERVDNVVDNIYGVKMREELEGKMEAIESLQKKVKKDVNNKRKHDFNNTREYNKARDGSKSGDGGNFGDRNKSRDGYSKRPFESRDGNSKRPGFDRNYRK